MKLRSGRPVGHWPLNEGLGVVAGDVSRNKNHGATSGGPVWTQLPSGLWVLYFDGTDDEVLIGTPRDLNMVTHDFTILCWLKTTSALANKGVIEKWSPVSKQFGLNPADGTHLAFYVHDGAPKSAALTIPYNDGLWHPVAMGHDGFNVFIWTDFESVTGDATAGGTSSPATDMLLGSYGPATYWNGYLSDVRIYNRYLHPSELYQWSKRTAPFYGRTIA